MEMIKIRDARDGAIAHQGFLARVLRLNRVNPEDGGAIAAFIGWESREWASRQDDLFSIEATLEEQRDRCMLDNCIVTAEHKAAFIVGWDSWEGFKGVWPEEPSPAPKEDAPEDHRGFLGELLRSAKVPVDDGAFHGEAPEAHLARRERINSMMDDIISRLDKPQPLVFEPDPKLSTRGLARALVEWVDSNPVSLHCEDRSCIRCRMVDLAYELEIIAGCPGKTV